MKLFSISDSSRLMAIAIVLLAVELGVSCVQSLSQLPKPVPNYQGIHSRIEAAALNDYISKSGEVRQKQLVINCVRDTFVDMEKRYPGIRNGAEGVGYIVRVDYVLLRGEKHFVDFGDTRLSAIASVSEVNTGSHAIEYSYGSYESAKGWIAVRIGAGVVSD